MKKYILLVSIAFFFFTSCKDDELTTETTETTTQKIQKKWELAYILDYKYVGMTTTLDNIDTVEIGMPGDFLDFKVNNTLEFSVDGDSDISTYEILEDTKILVGALTYNITTLTATEFVLTFEARSEDPYFDHVIQMKR